MKITKFVLALALFVSSVSFDKQVIVTSNGIDSHWNISVNVTNEAFAREMALEAML